MCAFPCIWLKVCEGLMKMTAFFHKGLGTFIKFIFYLQVITINQDVLREEIRYLYLPNNLSFTIDKVHMSYTSTWMEKACILQQDIGYFLHNIIFQFVELSDMMVQKEDWHPKMFDILFNNLSLDIRWSYTSEVINSIFKGWLTSAMRMCSTFSVFSRPML